MDLGISGKWAIVSGSTRGLGLACAEALAAEGANVVLNARTDTQGEQVALDLRERFGVKVIFVAADVSTAVGRERLFAAYPNVDILVTNASGPSPSSFVDNSAEQWSDAFDMNFHSAVGIMQLVLPGMRERKFGRIINITSAMVTSPHPFMTLSIAARTALTGVTKAVSKEVVSDNVTINNILPERIDTGRQRQMAELQVQFRGITLEEAYDEMKQTIAAKRLGRPDEVGAACAFLASIHAGYISGENLHLDGGSYDGLI
ncbi:MAG: SDR family oxidoreductase [Actinobacteria bacterium]|nr:SDR family oxidoreductase [Actinomycetota bacterium]